MGVCVDCCGGQANVAAELQRLPTTAVAVEPSPCFHHSGSPHRIIACLVALRLQGGARWDSVWFEMVLQHRSVSENLCSLSDYLAVMCETMPLCCSSGSGRFNAAGEHVAARRHSAAACRKQILGRSVCTWHDLRGFQGSGGVGHPHSG